MIYQEPGELLNNRKVWSILGLPFDEVDTEIARNLIDLAVKEKKRCFLTTPNLNFAIATQLDNAFFQSVVESDLNIADGMPLIWVAKLLGIPISERVAGSSLFEELSQQQNQACKIKVFFFGGQRGIAEQAHHKLNKNSLNMISCGYYDPGFVPVTEMSTENVIKTINDCEPDFIVVALGAQKGQEWIQRNKGVLNATVISHLGAVVNFVAGNIERAPLVWQRWGGEWLWRIRQEPALWKRYLFDGLAFIRLVFFNVLPLAVYDRILKRTPGYSVSSETQIIKEAEILIKLTGSVHHLIMQQHKQSFSKVIEEYQGDVVIDCEKLTYIDSAFIGTILLFQYYLNKQGRALALDNVSLRIIRILRLSSVMKRFKLL